MNIQTYNKVLRYQPYVIGTSAIDINPSDFYSVLLRNYTRMDREQHLPAVALLPTQTSIYTIQQMYLDLVEDDSINLMGVDLKFTDSTWDFSSLYKDGKIRAGYIYHFNPKSGVQFNDYQLVVLKLFVMYLVTEYGVHRGSNAVNFASVRRLLEFMSQKHISLVEHITVDDVKTMYEERDNINYSTMVKDRRHIREFLTFYSLIAVNVYTKEFDEYFKDINTDKIKATIEKNKTKLLPSEFYLKYSNALYTFATNVNESKVDRGLAGLLYIGTQTGLRGGELSILLSDCLVVTKYKSKQIGTLKYRSTKNGGKNKLYQRAETLATEKVIDVVTMLQALFADDRVAINSNLLVVNNNHRDNGKYKSIKQSRLQDFNAKYCLTHASELGLINSPDASMFECSLDYTTARRISLQAVTDNGIGETDIVSIPTIKQYRVYFASDMRERGIDDRTISYLFNHNSSEMWGYYVRPKHEVQEDIDFSKEIVREIIRNDTNILGPKGAAMKKKIDKIIKDNNFNVETDLNAIIDKVCSQVPIRAKEGGFCIKSNPRRECRHDAKTDDFLCAYGCCPNHCHMYFMLPVTYQKFKDLLMLINYNKINSFINQSQKEMYKLEAIITQELLPEIIDLEKQISKNGVDVVVERHPSIKPIIQNIKYLKVEIAAWQRKIQAMKKS